MGQPLSVSNFYAGNNEERRVSCAFVTAANTSKASDNSFLTRKLHRAQGQVCFRNSGMDAAQAEGAQGRDP
jgi:hypothetical protein